MVGAGFPDPRCLVAGSFLGGLDVGPVELDGLGWWAPVASGHLLFPSSLIERWRGPATAEISFAGPRRWSGCCGLDITPTAHTRPA